MTRVLIADDNTKNLYMLETVLKGCGYEVMSAQNGVETIALALENPPDLIITDILMPEMDGFELCRRCKADERLQQIPLIFYTATYTDLKDEQFALSLGADRFVIKPQQPEALVKIVQEVLAKPLKTRQISPKMSPGNEKEVLERYNEVLFRKLERKVLQLEDALTKQKMIENELRESEERYRSIFENSDDAILLTAPDGSIFKASPAACRMFGYTEAELIQLGRKGVIDITDARLPDALEKRKLTGRFRGELTFLRRDGQAFVGEMTSAVFQDKNGQARTSMIVRDITEHKQYQENLEKSHEKLKKTLHDAINSMAKIVEMRDPYTAGHQRKVADLASAIAKEMKLDGVQIENLHMAATIHDIGKMYVPSEILIKPGKLSDVEFRMIKTHSHGGYEIVKNIEFPPSVAQSILQHHERLDGSGYPNGLKNESICQEARIITVADVVEAMTFHRPYRPALGIDKALEELVKNKGNLYDPTVVDACLKVFTEKSFKFEQ